MPRYVKFFKDKEPFILETKTPIVIPDKSVIESKKKIKIKDIKNDRLDSKGDIPDTVKDKV